MADVATRAFTADELLRLPDDGLRHELVDGELRSLPPAGAEHGSVAMAIAFVVKRHVDEHGLGRVLAAETGFVLARGPDTVRAPDVAFVARERLERVGVTKGYWPEAPDLAVEVVSPSDTFTEVHEKALGWLAAGATLVLVADPGTQRITRYRSPAELAVLAGDEPVDLAPALPGLAPPARSLFA